MKKEKMNNKGFSLVELIIVIAIMAVLVVVLAPQYLKYVEKSRNSTDISNATAIVTACQVYAADPESTPIPVGTFTITVDKTTGIVASETVVQTALTDAKIDMTTKCKSKTAWDAYSVKGTVAADGSISFTYESTVGAGTDNGALQAAMNK